MTHVPQVVLNPALVDTRERNSEWIASRGLMPGRGAAGCCCPHFLANGGAMRAVANAALTPAAGGGPRYFAAASIGAVVDMGAAAALAPRLRFMGCWVIDDGGTWRAVYGVSVPAHGLTAPFGRSNVGHRAGRGGWVPSRNN